MTSSERRKTTYIPPATTFILGRNTALESTGYSKRPLSNPHWHTVREIIRKNHGFSVPDSNYSSGRNAEPARKPGYLRQTQNGGPRMDVGQRRPSDRDRKSQSSMQSEESMNITEQPNHFAAPALAFSDIERESSSNKRPNSDRKSNNKRPNSDRKSNNRPSQYRSPVGPDTPEDHRNDNENHYETPNGNYRPNDVQVNGYSGTRPLARSSSVYDPEDVRRRAEMIESLGDKQNDQPSGLDRGYRNDPGETEAGAGYDKDAYSDDEAPQLQNGRASNNQGYSSESDTDPSSQDDEKSLLTSDDKAEGKRSFFQRCAPSFAKKILKAVEKNKNECQLCLDEVAKKFKQQQMETEEPVFTNYSCENEIDSGQGLRASAKKKMSNLVGGFYCKACTGVKMLAERLFDEEEPSQDGTWTGIEGENGVRCVPHYDNAVEDRTLYICSCCFNEERDRNIFVSTKFLDNMYGCRAPVFVSRSFENRPACCEKVMQRMGKRGRKLYEAVIGRKFEMVGGVRCNSRVNKSEAEEQPNESDLSSGDLESSKN